MKKRIMYFSGILILSIFFACKKSDTTDVNKLTTDDAAETAAATLSSGNGGNSQQFEDASKLSELIINDTTSEKSSPVYDTTYVISKDSGRITYNYTLHYRYGIRYNSTSQYFESFMNYDTDGNFQSLKLTSADNSEGNLILTGLEQNSDYYYINGNVTRTGKHTSSIKEEKTFSATVTFNFNNITIRKSDYKITEGSGDISVNGKTEDEAEFSFTGSVIYKEDGTIILTINGEEYIIDMSSGEITS